MKTIILTQMVRGTRAAVVGCRWIDEESMLLASQLSSVLFGLVTDKIDSQPVEEGPFKKEELQKTPDALLEIGKKKK